MPTRYSAKSLPRCLGRERDGERRVDRQLCAAAHERDHENREHPVAPRLEHARREDCRHRAAEADEKRHERLSGQSQGAHEAIRKKRRPRDVTGVLEHREREKHGEDHGNEREENVERATDGNDHGDKPVGCTADGAEPSRQILEDRRAPARRDEGGGKRDEGGGMSAFERVRCRRAMSSGLLPFTPSTGTPRCSAR